MFRVYLAITHACSSAGRLMTRYWSATYGCSRIWATLPRYMFTIVLYRKLISFCLGLQRRPSSPRRPFLPSNPAQQLIAEMQTVISFVSMHVRQCEPELVQPDDVLEQVHDQETERVEEDDDIGIEHAMSLLECVDRNQHLTSISWLSRG